MATPAFTIRFRLRQEQSSSSFERLRPLVFFAREPSMSSIILSRRWLAAGAALALAACSSTPIATPKSANVNATGTAPVASAASAGHGTGVATQPAPATTALPAHLDPNSPIARERSVYFDYDEVVIAKTWMPVVERQGQYLAGKPSLQVRVEGNTDERGGAEYNLALGQRRADAVKRALIVYGVKDGQVETVSFGMERPRATGRDEAAWAQNRRADIVYPAAR
jgi:peptidoglycan-associated lipoprotein